MKKISLSVILSFCVLVGHATDYKITSPDGRLVVTVSDEGRKAYYTVDYDGNPMLTRSSLGLKASHADFTKNIALKKVKTQNNVVKDYSMTRVKAAYMHYVSNKMDLELRSENGHKLTIEFSVADNSVAFRYFFHKPDDSIKPLRLSAVVNHESTSFNFPYYTTSFLSQQSKTMTGFCRTKPSYEEIHVADAPLTRKSNSGNGFTFPCLFRIGEDGWVLVSETGSTSEYCGSRLSEYNPESGFTVSFPLEGENNGIGSSTPAVMLPSYTPWRTITVGKTLKPIVETTIQYDVVDPLYESKYDYRPGRYTWSWVIWGEASMNYKDQIDFVDLASTMGYEYVLVDARWNERLGYERIAEISKYAQNKGVHLFLWYNSNGAANDAPQGPRGVMNNAIRRKKDMAWMQKIGVKGIKVDFFGGDKQQTMQLYEDILSDANDYGLQVIFHGCTLPRGWERLYPNFVASEAALASENVKFSEHHAKSEGFEMTMHPFSRNAVAAFDWGGVFLNKRFSRDNNSRHPRYTSDIFELATAITNQTSVNCVAIMPNNLTEIPQFELDFARNIPTTWEETRFVDGYPGKYCVIARRHGSTWYVGGLNGTDQVMTLTLDLPMLTGQTVKYYTDNKKKTDETYFSSILKSLKVDEDGKAKVVIQPMGGIILQN
mgnify:FL=1